MVPVAVTIASHLNLDNSFHMNLCIKMNNCKERESGKRGRLSRRNWMLSRGTN